MKFASMKFLAQKFAMTIGALALGANAMAGLPSVTCTLTVGDLGPKKFVVNEEQGPQYAFGFEQAGLGDTEVITLLATAPNGEGQFQVSLYELKQDQTPKALGVKGVQMSAGQPMQLTMKSTNSAGQAVQVDCSSDR